MAAKETAKEPAKKGKISIKEYLKLKEARAKKKLQLQFPAFVWWLAIIPAAYAVFLIIYFVIHLRFLSEH